MPSLLVLGIESSTPRGGVAIVRMGDGDPEVLAERAIDEGVRHGQALLPALAEVLAEAGAGKRDLDLIVGGTGPGSYTSLRVGLALARTLAFALPVPLLGVPSFDAAAHGLEVGAAPPPSLLVTTDAYRGEVYVGRYEPRDGVWTRDGAIRCASPEAALEGVPRPIRVLGGGPPRYPDAFAGEGIEVLAEALYAPAARDLAILGGRARLAGKAPDPRGALPLYLRDSLPS